MIIILNINNENIYYKIYNTINGVFAKLNVNEPKTKGRPKKYSAQ